MVLGDRQWRQYLRFITEHPLWTIAAVLAVTLFLGYQSSRLVLNNDADDWFPEGNPAVETTNVINELFGGRYIVVIGVKPTQGDIYQPAVLEKIARLQDNVLRIPEVIRSNVVSIAAQKAKAIRGRDDGMEVHRLLTKIPKTPEEIARLKQDIAANPFYVGTLVSADGKFASVIADFKHDENAVSQAPLYRAIEDAVNKERDASVNLYLGGAPVDFATVEIYATEKGPIFFGVAFLIILFVQYWSFRSLQGMLLPMGTAILSVIWALGIMRSAGFHLNATNITTTILIMAVVSGHAIQLLKRYYEEYGKLAAAAPIGTDPREINKAAVVESVSQVGLVMVIAGVIATATFYSLTASNVGLIRQFGFMAGSGILSGLIIEMTLIPALRSRLRPPHQHESKREAEEGILDRILRLLAGSVASDRRAPWILIGGVVLVLAIGAGAFRLYVDNSMIRYLAEDHPVRQADKVLNESMGGTNTLYFLVEGQNADSIKDPRVLSAMDRLQTFLNAQPDVGKTQSLADMVKRMNQAMHNDDPRHASIPQDPALVAQYLFLYTLSGDPDDFNNFVDNDYQRALVWVFLKTDSTAYAKSLIDKAQSILTKEFPPGVNVRIGGPLANLNAVNEVIVHEKILNTAQMAVMIFVLTSLLLRSMVGGLFVVTPVLIIVLANFGILGWLGLPLNIGTGTSASMAIGIGADYELYLLYRFREELVRAGGDLRIATERSLMTSGKAILFVSLAVAAGYAVLLTSDYAFYSQLALAVIVTMAVSAFSAIIFLRAMLMVFRPRFVFGDTRLRATLSN